MGSEFLDYVKALALACVLSLFIILFVAQNFFVDGHSMEPTLSPGQRLMVEKVSYRYRSPARGEVIVFRYPAGPQRLYVKRVIGLPEDMVEISQGELRVNGVPIVEDYIWGRNYPDLIQVVPVGHLFVLGDNRENSEDSRFSTVGMVPIPQVVGRVIAVFWPLGQVSWIRLPSSFAQLEEASL